jgi:hypothetical protein
MRKFCCPLIIMLSTVIIHSGSYAQQAGALPHIVVYKAAAKYKNHVAIELSADGKKIVSYPDPKDIKTGAGSPVPVSLHGGYWLDKRGVSIHTAFLKLTYHEYSLLKEVPSQEALYKLIVDKKPIKELCDCGKRGEHSYTVEQLNKLIDKKELKKNCISIK